STHLPGAPGVGGQSFRKGIPTNLHPSRAKPLIIAITSFGKSSTESNPRRPFITELCDCSRPGELKYVGVGTERRRASAVYCNDRDAPSLFDYHVTSTADWLLQSSTLRRRHIQSFEQQRKRRASLRAMLRPQAKQDNPAGVHLY